jgi:hypothetical protein
MITHTSYNRSLIRNFFGVIHLAIADAAPPLAQTPQPPSDFGKKTADVIRDVKNYVGNKPDSVVDRQIKEQLNSDFDRLIEKHDPKK